MSYKTILVHLDGGRHRRERLNLAFDIAERYDAHLVGLFGLEPVLVPSTPEIAPALLDQMMKQRRGLAETVATEFRDKIQKEQYGAKSEWRSTLDNGFAALEFHAKYVDLVVAGQPDPLGGEGMPAGFAHRLVMSIGRPVLYVPF